MRIAGDKQIKHEIEQLTAHDAKIRLECGLVHLDTFVLR